MQREQTLQRFFNDREFWEMLVKLEQAWKKVEDGVETDTTPF